MIHDYIVNMCGATDVSNDIRYIVGMFVIMFAIEGVCNIVKEIIARTVGGGKL